MLKAFYIISIAAIVTASTVAKSNNVNFHVLFTQSLYGTPRYARPNAIVALVGAINIVTPCIPCDNIEIIIGFTSCAAICGVT